VINLINNNLINGCANITGGGIKDNIARIIPNKLCAEIFLNKIKPTKIFRWLKMNKVKDTEMLKTFNCGVGFCLIINPKKFKIVTSYFSREYKPLCYRKNLFWKK